MMMPVANGFTDEKGNTYIGGPDWQVSSDPFVAQLVEAAYYIGFYQFVRKSSGEMENEKNKFSVQMD